MPTRRHRAGASLAALGVLALPNAGCGKPAGEITARAATAGHPPVARVATVTPERMTVRRTTEQPGQIEAAETTPIYAKLAGYVESVAVRYRRQGQEGPGARGTPRAGDRGGRSKQKQAMTEQARSEKTQAEAAVEVSRAGVIDAPRRRSRRSRPASGRADADVARWRAEFARIEQLFRERAQTGSLLDETRNKLRAAEATREEVRAQVKSAEAALAEAKAHLDKARSDVQTAIAHIEVARFEAERAEAMAATRRSSPRSTAS